MASTAAILDILVRANTTQATAALTRTQTQLKTTQKQAAGTSAAIGGKLAKGAKLGGMALAGTLAYGLYKSVQVGADFEKQMDSLGAAAGATRQEMEALREQALKLGQDTAYSASEAAQAQTELVKGGIKVKDVIGGALPAALNLAAAGEIQLAAAAETTANAMQLFGLSGKQAGHVADLLATAANKTTADVEDFAMALKQGGGVAKLAGYDINETVQVLEAMAAAGYKNSDAGTSMKAAMIQLIKPTEKQAALAKQLGLSFVDQNGEMKKAEAISRQLRVATDGMTKSERARVFTTLAGTDGVRTLQALYDAGPAKLDKYAEANERVGVAQDIAREKMDNTAGSIEQLKGALETLGIRMFAAIGPPLRRVIDLATEGVQALSEIDLTEFFNSPAVRSVVKAIRNLGIAIGWLFKHVVEPMLPGILRVFEGLAKGIGGVVQIISGILTGDLGRAWEGVKDIFEGSIDYVLGILDALTAPFRKALKPLGGLLVRVFKGAWSLVTGAFRKGADVILGMLSTVLDGMADVVEFGSKIPVFGDKFGDASESIRDASDSINEFRESLRDTDKTSRDTKFNDLLKGLEKINLRTRKGRKEFVAYFSEFGKDLRKAATDTRGHQRLMSTVFGSIGRTLSRGEGDLDSYYMGLARNFGRANDKSRELRERTGGNATLLSVIVGNAFGTIGENTNSILGSLGAKKIAFQVKQVKSGNNATGWQTGGVIPGFANGAIVPGYGSGDKVPLHLGGRLAAMVEPGELVSVANKKATAALMAHNDAVPRFATGGVIQQALGPYDMPPIVYDPNHAGGNSHLHLDFFTKQQALTYGHRMQGMGWRISEYSGSNPYGFGPVTVQHQSPGHYDGTAFDANTMAGETREEVAAVVRMLGGAGGAAGAAAVAEKVKRLLLKGPDGPLKTMGQAAIDKVTKAANAYISENMPIDTGPGKYGPPAKIANLPASLRKYNQRYEAHWAPDYGGYAMPPRDIAKLAEWAGGGRVPGWTMQQVTEGESGGRPGSAGVDPGGTKGYGLWAITSPFANSLVAPYGGYEAMWNPVLNALVMAKMYPTGWSGGSPWYGTSHVSDYNKHYTGKLQRGGIVDIPKAIRRTLGATDGKDHTAAELRKRIAHRLGKQIKHFSDRGIPLTRDGGELAGRLANLRADVDRYGSYASNAGRLTDEGILGLFRAGTEDDISGYANGSEAYWTFKQLGKLLDLRNALIAAEKLVDKRRKRVMELLEQSKVKLREWEKRLRQAEHVLGQKGKSPEKWKGVNPATGKVEEWNKLADDKRAALAHKFTAAGGRLPGDRKFLEDDSIATPASHPGLFPNVAGMKGVRSLLQNTVIPGLTQERTDLRNGMSRLLSELDTVQGNVPDMRHYKTAPALGVLGGEIFDAQSTLAELGADASKATTDSDLADLLRQQLAESRRETALLRAQMPVFRSAVPYLGAFASGGVALVGERGPELATMPSGTRITSAADTRAMLEPEISLVLNDCTIDTHGKSLEDTVKVLINGELRSIAQTSKGRAPSRV